MHCKARALLFVTSARCQTSAHKELPVFVLLARHRCDNDSFLNSNRVPIDKMIAFLEQYFSPDTPGDDAYSLAISAGEDGARLTHSHARQYNFALQARFAAFVILYVVFTKNFSQKGSVRIPVKWGPALGSAEGMSLLTSLSCPVQTEPPVPICFSRGACRCAPACSSFHCLVVFLTVGAPYLFPSLPSFRAVIDTMARDHARHVPIVVLGGRRLAIGDCALQAH